MTPPPALPALPAIVISGFLGAGKTTLLNRLLAHGVRGTRIGVIVNDFGKLNIDRHLIDDGRHPVVELSNGCVCCSLRLGLSEAVAALAARGGIDRLVIEASGISVSSALLDVLKSPLLAGTVRVSNVVAVVDARRYRLLHALPVIRDQVACADLLVLNHCDQADAAMADWAKERLAADNDRAKIILTDHGEVPPELILNERPPRNELKTTVGRHDQRWHPYEITLRRDVDPDVILALLDRLPASVERVKGLVSRGRGEWQMLQKVAGFPATLEPLPHGPLDKKVKPNTLVIIAGEPIETELKNLFGQAAVLHAASD